MIRALLLALALVPTAHAQTTNIPRTTDGMYESVCHEGNHGLDGILRGARVAEQRTTPQTGLALSDPKAKP